MRVARRAVLALVALPLGGCAALARGACRSDALRQGEYLGNFYTGTNCSTSTTTERSTHNGKPQVTTKTDTTCVPQYEDRWRWNASSDAYLADCLAEVERRYPSQPPAYARPPYASPYAPAPPYQPPPAPGPGFY